MKEKVKFYGSIFIMILFVPYLITVYLRDGFQEISFFRKEDVQSEQRVEEILASEIPADYEMECLKAQAVIARTNLVRQMQEGQAVQEETGWTEAQMRAAWGQDYEKNRERIAAAVAETKGQILTWYGETIQAAYHTACSAKTRNASEVPGQAAYCYLVSVDSPDDILADGFLSIGTMQKEAFADALAALFPDETMDAGQLPGALQIVERDKADYVTKVQYGRTIVSGEAVRSALHLNSACFYLSETDGKIRIVTKGIGHGLGFSQFGAQQLAKKGDSYEELLHYYYADVDIKKTEY